MNAADTRPLVAHVVFRFDVGGLENGLVNLLNRLPADRYRHAVIALTEATRFRERVERSDIEFVSLYKGPGHGVRLAPRLFRLFRQLRPAIVHTRNLAALEASAPAWLARVPIRIHGEHGWDVGDLQGSNRAYRLARRAYAPFVTHYVAVSEDLERYLIDAIRVAPDRISRIINGVDIAAFRRCDPPQAPADCPFNDAKLIRFGTVGRLQAVKNQTLLADAFVRVLEIEPALRGRLRLIIAGDGPLREPVLQILERANARELAWLPGSRRDVKAIMQALDFFVLPSLAEGISNTILEAMASGLPVVATHVGGNSELVHHATTGTLVPSGDVDAMARAMLEYVHNPELARSHGRAGRARAEQEFGLDVMVSRYAAVYDRLIDAYRARKAVVASTAAEAHGGGH